ncbi:hypothetical protein M433DRAFT_74305 [Acidomyces richmondensis BFW]|nr:hypothetical protein M433DRAFT_74305 [Acidomyces richmondensis BFW]
MIPPKILLHGSGAIGTIYVYLLQLAGSDVIAVCRSNYEVAKSSGFLIDSELYGKGIRIRPNVVRTPAEAAVQLAEGEAFDYVVVTAKAMPDAKISEIIAPAITKGRTCIVLIQNGVGIEEEYRQRFPQNPLLSCVVYLPTTQIALGHIEMGDFERLEVGTFPARQYDASEGVAAATDKFVELVRKGGSHVQRFHDIQARRWKKLILNASWNPICALTLNRDVVFLASSPAAERLVQDVMHEVISIAQSLGYKDITDEMAEKQLSRAKARIGGKGIEPSMLMDVLNERRMEVEVILGNPVRIAKQKGVNVPKMEALYALSKALDNAIQLREPGRSLGGDEVRSMKEPEASL